MSTHITVNDHPIITVNYYGVMHMSNKRYSTDYKWTCLLVHHTKNNSFNVEKIIWDTNDDLAMDWEGASNKNKAEKRIGDLCLKAWKGKFYYEL